MRNIIAAVLVRFALLRFLRPNVLNKAKKCSDFL